MKALYSIAFFLFSVSLYAQQQSELYEEDVPLIYHHEMSIGWNVHSNGMGAVFRKGKQKTVSRKHYYEVEAVGMQHPKEYKFTYYEDGGKFVFGKLNSLMLVRTGLGVQRIICGKGDRLGVEVRFNNFAGISWGFAKPVYLYVLVPAKDGSQKREPEIRKYDPYRYNVDDIYAQADYKYGLSELSVYPGLYAKTGFSFDFASFDTGIKGLETGVVIDAFPKVIPVMAFTRNPQVYLSFYFTVYFGTKW